MTKPTYDANGQPLNLEAAALDAMEWMRLVQDHIRQMRGQTVNVQRLAKDRDGIARCIKALESFLGETTT